ncbi:MAG: hypothetical protein LUP95_05160 [Euryarchaeota archaeon]|nr:hypothetical protein [Euryarchaeota archaeon]
MFDCVNASGLTFVFDDKQGIDLARIRFTVAQKTHSGPITKGQRDAPAVFYTSGTLDPKDSDSAYLLLQQALDNKPFSVYGRFEDACNDDEAEWQLTNVLFDHVAPGRLSDWTFHALASKR